MNQLNTAKRVSLTCLLWPNIACWLSIKLCDFFRGTGPVLLRTLYFCDFSGGGSVPPVPPPLDPPMTIPSLRKRLLLGFHCILKVYLYTCVVSRL